MKVWMEHRPERVISPLSFWVHRHLGTDAWFHAEEYDPPMPKPVPSLGWPIYILEHRGQQLVFASVEEIDHAIEVLKNKALPTTRRLAQQAGYGEFQHGHWLSKLSKAWKPWKVRKELVETLIAFRNRQKTDR
jgi:hypothetical protein